MQSMPLVTRHHPERLICVAVLKATILLRPSAKTSPSHQLAASGLANMHVALGIITEMKTNAKIKHMQLFYVCVCGFVHTLNTIS